MQSYGERHLLGLLLNVKMTLGHMLRSLRLATYINVTSHILSASRSVKPFYFFPNIFCIHLVNKLYILLNIALQAARPQSPRRGRETSCSTIAIALSNALRSALAAP